MKASELGEAETVATPATGPGAPSSAAVPELEVVDRERYEIDAELARGGMGRILHAVDRRHGRRVAIKELLSDTPALRARFRREALITARLQHPAIVPVYEAGAWPSGEPFFAMKMVEGRSLDAVIAGRRTLEARMGLLPNVIAVAEAIAYAHEREVIHRDLKPGNVLVGDFGETVVIDWGLAKDLRTTEPAVEGAGVDAAPASDLETAVVTADEVPDGVPLHGLTVAGAAMGTPAYMAPEQARGEQADARADVYALGGILYHLLTGRMPYADSKDGGALVERKRLDQPPAEVTALEPAAPRDLVAIVAKAMARRPEDRYPTAKQLVDDLRRFETGQLVSVHDYSSGELIRRWLHRHRIAVGFATALVLVVIVGGALAVTRVLREKDRATAALETAERERARAEEASRVAAEERAAAERDRERAEESEQEALAAQRQAQGSTQALVEGWVQTQFATSIRDCYAKGKRGARRHASLLLEVDDAHAIAKATPVHPFGTSADACIVAASAAWKLPPGTRAGTYGLNLMADEHDRVQIGFAASDHASISRLMSRDFDVTVDRCYAQLRRTSPKARGRVEAAVTAGKDGVTTVSSLSAFDPTLERCIRDELERWVFAPPRFDNGEPADVTLEVVLILEPPVRTDQANAAARTGSGNAGGKGKIGTGKVEPAPVGGGQPDAPALSLAEQDRAMVRRYIKRNLAKITYCYERVLLEHPALSGTVETSFRVGMGGLAFDVEASGMNDEVASCVADVIARIEFLSPAGGAEINVTSYPFTFEPTAPAAAE